MSCCPGAECSGAGKQVLQRLVQIPVICRTSRDAGDVTAGGRERGRRAQVVALKGLPPLFARKYGCAVLGFSCDRRLAAQQKSVVLWGGGVYVVCCVILVRTQLDRLKFTECRLSHR